MTGCSLLGSTLELDEPLFHDTIEKISWMSIIFFGRVRVRDDAFPIDFYFRWKSCISGFTERASELLETGQRGPFLFGEAAGGAFSFHAGPVVVFIRILPFRGLPRWKVPRRFVRSRASNAAEAMAVFPRRVANTAISRSEVTTRISSLPFPEQPLDHLVGLLPQAGIDDLHPSGEVPLLLRRAAHPAVEDDGDPVSPKFPVTGKAPDQGVAPLLQAFPSRNAGRCRIDGSGCSRPR